MRIRLGLLLVTPDQGGRCPTGHCRVAGAARARCQGRVSPHLLFLEVGLGGHFPKHLCGRSFHGFATEEKGVRIVEGGTTYIQTYVCIYIVCIYREGLKSLSIYASGVARAHPLIHCLLACGQAGRCCSCLALLCVVPLPLRASGTHTIRKASNKQANNQVFAPVAIWLK